MIVAPHELKIDKSTLISFVAEHFIYPDNVLGADFFFGLEDAAAFVKRNFPHLGNLVTAESLLRAVQAGELPVLTNDDIADDDK